ncbi:MAG: pyridoxamine 5'-phosphate oxidase family protein [Candidatus Pacebacteria bacterium]|nr:pyridoxamine 5'-phosphate oxidase family protein [Candidatus Paceibacterota bacterium]
MTIDPTVRAEALTFLRSHSAGVLATVAKDYTPIASVVYYVCDDSFNIYFLTKRDSRKFHAISAHPQAAFVVGRQDIPQTLQLSGVASELVSSEDQNAHVTDLMNVLAAQRVGLLPAGKMDGELAVMWFQPRSIRWADFTKPAIGNENLFFEIPVN